MSAQPFRYTMDHTVYPNLISFGNGNVYCDEVTNNHNNIVSVKRAVARENGEIMQWPSSLDPRGRHQDVHTDREFAFGKKTSSRSGGVIKMDPGGRLILFSVLNCLEPP